jgi:glutathione synthase/RimK-type ligase-like ATP-grasp enzyme
MLNSERIFVDAIKRYCAGRGIAVELRAEGWLVVMERGDKRLLAFGHDLGLNSAVAHKIANDKSATAEVLAMSGVSCVPHALFMNPRHNAPVPPRGSWEAMLALLKRHRDGVVVKPNEGTAGKCVFLASTRPALERAVNLIFSTHASLSISPYLKIEEEVRVVLLDGIPLAVYGKHRPAVVGDGERSLLELALASLPAEQQSMLLPGMLADFDRYALKAIVPAGERRVLNWRHNLESGARPSILERGPTRDACVELAVNAARAIDIRFASIDAVRAEASWQVLEINSGVMMEALGRLHPELVYSVYGAALDKLFA